MPEFRYQNNIVCLQNNDSFVKKSNSPLCCQRRLSELRAIISQICDLGGHAVSLCLADKLLNVSGRPSSAMDVPTDESMSTSDAHPLETW